MALRVYLIVALCAEMEQGNLQAVSASTASSSQNTLTGGVAARGSAAASSSKNSTTSGGGGKVAVTKRSSVLTLERKLEIISEVKKGKSVRQCLVGVPKSTVNDIWT